MKQIIQLIIIIYSVSVNLFAQETPTIAPDFTVEDINGETYNLYEILGSGKTVILDFYTTWCPPCWVYHNGKELSKMWERHGPSGFDDYVILAIESDQFTGIDDIMGTGDNTLGNWFEDTEYPIVDNNQIQNLFDIPGYPTYLHICTDRTVTEMELDFSNPNRPSVEDYEAERLGCSVPESPNNITAFAYDAQEVDICDELTFSPSIEIRNSGSNNITSCIAQLYIEDIVQEEIIWNGQLGTYQHTSIPFTDLTIDKETKLEIKLIEPNGSADTDPTDNLVTQNLDVVKTISTKELQLELKTDFRGSETYWAILDENEDIVAEGGNLLVGLDNIGNINSTAPDHPSAYDNNETVVETISLSQNGCYSLVITDYSSNGICCNLGIGRYILRDENGFIVAVGGEFQDKVSHNFKFEGGTTSVRSDILNMDIAFWPNPVDNILNIDFELEMPMNVDVQLTNIYGHEIERSKERIASGKHLLSYNMDSYPEGIYFVSIISEEGIVSKKVIKN